MNLSETLQVERSVALLRIGYKDTGMVCLDMDDPHKDYHHCNKYPHRDFPDRVEKAKQ